MIQAAGELDVSSDALTSGRRALIATLIFGGLRLGEACSLDWRHINLADGLIYVLNSKTEAGLRNVKVLPRAPRRAARPQSQRRRHRARLARFITAAGNRRRVDNARQRVMEPVIARADQLLARAGAQPLPEGVTAH